MTEKNGRQSFKQHCLFALAFLMLMSGCATSDPKLVQAAKWQKKEQERQMKREEKAYHSKHAGEPAPVFMGPDAADPMVNTPYGQYRLSVLKKAISELESQDR